MQADLSQGLIVLLIGMASVFAILSLIVVAGRMLIYAVNKAVVSAETLLDSEATPEEVVVIASVVHQLTGGKGQVLNISSKEGMKSNG